MRGQGRNDEPPWSGHRSALRAALNYRTFVARMTGPFIHILKNVTVKRFQVSFVEIAFRAIAFSNFR